MTDDLRNEANEPESIDSELEAVPETKTETPSTGEPVAGTEAEFEAEVEAAAAAELDAEEAEEAEEVEAEIEIEAEDGPEPETEEAAPASEGGLEPEAASEAESEPETATEDEPKAEIESKSSPETEAESESEPEFTPKPRPPAKLERLQKILAKAGVASRRKAEEMIEQGRVQINGKVVTELGTKADAGRDHIRVDGKLLQGAERLRYFVLNKPKGFVTTVKDPEGRPTVMQFFDKMKERLYPVGRLDYMSEGLLVVTNDGELANRLTKASSGVEKTYLVKVAGQPTEDELELLRRGVSIERGKPGSGQVRTSPARIRQVRQGDNPWFEVVLIEGRNRELRKMFEEIGHFVEKIRRVGYGPLVLDQEPGNLRELEPEELDLLRKTAEGKLRTPKAKELRRRNLLDSQLPTLPPRRTMHPRPAKPAEDAQFEAQPFDAQPFDQGSAAAGRPGAFRPKRASGPGQFKARPAGPAGEKFRPAAGRTPDRGPAGSGDRPLRAPGAGPAKFGSARPAGRSFDRTDARPAGRPAWKKDDRPTRPPSRFDTGSASEDRPRTDRLRTSSTGQDAEGTGRTGAGRPFTAKPTWKKSERPGKPPFKRPLAPRREVPGSDEDLGPVRPPNLRIEEIQGPDRPERSTFSRPSSPRSYPDRSGSKGPYRSSAPRAASDRPGADRPRPDRAASPRPFRSEGGLARPYTTSSGKPRAGGARPSSKPGGKPAGRSYGSGARPGGSGSRSIDPRTGSGYRPQPGGKRSFDGPSGGSAKRPFRREQGEGSFTPRPASGSSRPFTPRTEGASDYRPTQRKPYPNSASRAERKAGPGWKPKPAFGGAGKPASGSHSKPKSGGFSKSGYKSSGYKAKPGGSGGKRTGGPRPGGKRPGGAPGGKKRG